MTCPHCSAAVDESRILESSAVSRRVASGSDTEYWFWTFVMSCQGCLGLFESEQVLAEEDHITARKPGTEIARLRERLAEAARTQSLESEVLALISTHMLELATPELFELVEAALGAHWTLQAGALRATDDATFDMLAGRATLPPRLLERGGELPAGTALRLVGVRERAFVFSVPDGTRVRVSPSMMAFGESAAPDALVVRRA